MKYLWILLLAGSVWGDCLGKYEAEFDSAFANIDAYYNLRGEILYYVCGPIKFGDGDTIWLDDKHVEVYLDTVEVKDTVWYYSKKTTISGCGLPWPHSIEDCVNINVTKALERKACDSIPKITTRKSVICKQKKQVWLTEDEYERLMELLNPKPDIGWYYAESLAVHPIWIDLNWAGDSIDPRIGR